MTDDADWMRKEHRIIERSKNTFAIVVGISCSSPKPQINLMAVFIK